MRKKIVAGNWKMNTTPQEGRKLVQDIISQDRPEDVELIIAPPFTHLAYVHDVIKDADRVSLGAQNSYFKLSGAYTGEISPEMLQNIGVKYVILGHSERRSYFQEDDFTVYQKMQAVIESGMKPILCVGELLKERELDDHFKVVQKQLEETLCKFSKTVAQGTIVAYEPVWAIGTGKTATAEQANEMHGFIREVIAHHFDQVFADQLAILYGGSCNPGNAKELFSQYHVDGGLIGGASLKASDFVSIARSF